MKDLQTESRDLKMTNEKSYQEFLHKVQEKALELKEKEEAFYKYKRTTALAVPSSRTGMPLPESIIEQLEATERKKESEVVAVRLEHIKLRNKLSRQEAILRQKV